MNKYQKTQDQAARKILRHIGVENKTAENKNAYRAIRKMLKAMSETMLWMEKRKKKEHIDFGDMSLDYSKEGVVRVIVKSNYDGHESGTVISEIRKNKGE